MNDKIYHVLFLCTGNSARSIMAQSLLTHWGKGRFVAYSAGSRPKGEVHPMALELLELSQLPTAGLRSKSWLEYGQADAPHFDFVFTLCDSAANEPCPAWRGQPITAHWGVADPAAEKRGRREQIYAFRRAMLELENRIKLFVSLPLDALDRMQCEREVQSLGKLQLIPSV